MYFNTLTRKDLDSIRYLQPEGWSDIVTEFDRYIHYKYCYPVKITFDNKIVGVGAAIALKKTGWLAHIIVDENHRNKGIGYQITQELIRWLKGQMVKTFLLISTDLGKRVYQKSGFREVTKYIYLTRESPWILTPSSKYIVPFTSMYYRDVIETDKIITGENRETLFKEYFNGSLLYIENRELKGFFVPGLGEGPIIAQTDKAGLKLMNIKYAKAAKAAIPSENITGIEFLKAKGFKETGLKGTRMILGDEIRWQPEKIFSRIGGNLG